MSEGGLDILFGGDDETESIKEEPEIYLDSNSDITLKVKDKIYLSHKILLKSCTNLIDKLSENSLEFPYDPKDFEEFLIFLKSKRCLVTKENYLQLLQIAEDLENQNFIDYCLSFILEDKNITLLFDHVLQGKLSSKVMPVLKEELKLRLYNRTDKIFKSTDFVNLSEEIITTMISDDRLNLYEFDILKGLLKWAEHKQKKTNLDLPKILENLKKFIRLPLIESEKLITMKGFDIFTTDEFIDAFEYNLDQSIINNDRKEYYNQRNNILNYKLDIESCGNPKIFNLSNDGKSVYKKTGKDWDCIYGCKGWNSDVVFYEIFIDKLPKKSTILVGIVNDPKGKNQSHSVTSISSSGKIQNLDLISKEEFKVNDKVGVYLDFENLKVYFFINRNLKAQGKLIKGKTYFPAIFLNNPNCSITITFPFSKPKIEENSKILIQEKLVEKNEVSKGSRGLFGDDEDDNFLDGLFDDEENKKEEKKKEEKKKEEKRYDDEDEDVDSDSSLGLGFDIFGE